VDEQTPDEVLRVESPEQYKALAHPLRHRLLFALGERPATTGQLAAALDTGKGTVAHHLKVLREAGMVRVVRTRPVRGGTEQYYQRTARRFDFAGPGGPAQASVIVQAVAEELGTAQDEPLLIVRNLRLSAERSRELMNRLTELVDGLTDAGPAESRYGMMVTVYRPRQPDPALDAW
jgi:DNA-binding transcriptional ArsR family regulator